MNINGKTKKWLTVAAMVALAAYKAPIVKGFVSGYPMTDNVTSIVAVVVLIGAWWVANKETD